LSNQYVMNALKEIPVTGRRSWAVEKISSKPYPDSLEDIKKYLEKVSKVDVILILPDEVYARRVYF